MSKQRNSSSVLWFRSTTLAKILSIVYLITIFVVLTVVANNFGSTNPHASHSARNILADAALGIVPLLFPALISIMQSGMYDVLIFGRGNKKRHPIVDQLDERQLDNRRRIFEKSYAVLGAVALFSAFTLPSWFAEGISTNGTFIIAFNIGIFVIGLPAIVATWDKQIGASVPSEE